MSGLLQSNIDLNANSSQTLEFFASLLSQVYDSQPQDFVKQFSSLSGLACLCSELLLVNGAKRKFLTEILGLVLADQRIVCKLTPADPARATLLFCGSRILASASRDVHNNAWFCDARKYTYWLAVQLTKFMGHIPSGMLDKLFKLGHAQEAFKVLFTKESWDKFIDAYSLLSSSSKRFILTAFLKSTDLPPPAIASIWKELAFGDTFTMLQLAIPLDLDIQRAAVIWPSNSELESALIQLLAAWGSPVAITQFTIPVQTAQTQLILGCASQLDPQQLAKITKSLEFSEGVTAHLSADSERSREMATVVGQVLARKGGDVLKFDIEYDHRYFFSAESILPLSDALAPQSAPADVENMIDEFLVFDEPPKVQEAVGDSDDEDDEEDLPVLVYVRDLLAFLLSDDYAKHHAAMLHGPELLLRKAHFGEEVSQYASQLLAILAGLTDKYNVADFAQQRQKLLEAVLVADPKMGTELCRILGGGDFSLYQRVSMMNALVGAARDLAEYKPQEFATQKLPVPALHNAFYSEVDALTSSIQTMLISGPEGEVTARAGIKFNQFSRVAARHFFYPLLSAAPKSYGSYTLLVYRHWVKTLGLLIYFSFPSNDMGDMVTQILRVLIPARSTAPEAVFTCILLLCDVAPAILLQHMREISDLCEWSGETWPTLQDPKEQQLGAACYYKLSKLLRDLQSKFIGES